MPFMAVLTGALDLDGEIGLLNLARGGALPREEEIARQLHGERGCALEAAVGAQVIPDRFHDAEYIHAPVGLELLVFNGDHGLAQHRSEVVVADHFAALEGKGSDDAALAVIEFCVGGGPIVLEVVDLRQIDGVDQGEAGQRAGDDGEQEQHGQRKLTRKLAPVMQ